jgi:hypothetical protein
MIDITKVQAIVGYALTHTIEWYTNTLHQLD